MSFIIKEATLEDLPTILTLISQSTNERRLSIETAVPLLKQMKSYPDYKLFIITEEKRIIGTFSLLIMDNLAHQGTPSGIIDNLVLDVKRNQQGIRQAVMDFAIQHCRDRKCYKLTLSNDELITEELSDFEHHGKCFVVDFESKARKDRKNTLFISIITSLKIREATEEDLPEILNLYAQPDMDDGNILSPQQAIDLYKKMRSYPNYKIFVSLSEGAVVGTFALLIAPDLIHDGKCLAIIEDVMVSPKTQGKGIGKFMMNFAMHTCDDLGCYKMALSSNLKRETAHNFYKSLGFDQIGASFLIKPRPELKVESVPAKM
ncbi:GNAT family N-acetyltransferase [Legionella maioricensis]|uniref:GNAT family N-acetyltransferase n=1 Tax=Legionella maioricensis TaxID=2896528 RepID=A0A9X2IBH5_9GAMM|nr:GNAT family N-acetyltransferase [Legionella maioricensis]MCL9682778.1 GNAT family N-acetyltransferase [Legionella maioricensis]MCL9686594.1 GNAT family N-acetyltransferase [Legionella maioricensis]